MSPFNRAQRLAWESALQRATEALDDPNHRTTRLGVRLRNVTTALQECLRALVRAADVVAQAEQHAARCDARLTDLVSLLPMSYLVTARDGTIRAANDAAAAALNVSARALLGRNLLVFFDDRDAWTRLLTCLGDSEAVGRVGNLRPRERVPSSVSATLSVVAGSDGHSVQWLLIQTSTVVSSLAATG